jgi:hypothetical protein
VVSTGLSLVSLDDCNDYDDRDYCDYREDLDDVITIDSRAETAGDLTVLAVEDTSQTELLNVRVRWVDHNCKVNSDELDEGATLDSW